MRRLSERTLHHIEASGPRYLPCPKRKNHADVAVEACRINCPWARRCPVFQRWLRPALPFESAHPN